MKLSEIKEIEMSTALLGVILFLSGGLVTGGTIWGIQNSQKKRTEEYTELITAVGSIKSEVAEAQLITTENLTDTDLLKVPCSSEYIKENNSDLLCREMFCRLQSRGLDAASSQAECEEISNLQNSMIILETCRDLEEGAYRACINVFTQRK